MNIKLLSIRITFPSLPSGVKVTCLLFVTILGYLLFSVSVLHQGYIFALSDSTRQPLDNDSPNGEQLSIHIKEAEAISVYLPYLSSSITLKPVRFDFSLFEKRLWDIEETGGSIEGGTVNCGNKHELQVIVLGKDGNRLNGVAIESLIEEKESFVTGDHDWQDGEVVIDLQGDAGAAQAVKVAEGANGEEVASEIADGITTHSPEIPHKDLIAARYCSDMVSCDNFNRAAGCWGFHSWTVIFRQN